MRKEHINNCKEVIGNIVDWLIYPALVSLFVAIQKNPELKCLTSLFYSLTPIASFGVREIRERVGELVKTKKTK